MKKPRQKRPGSEWRQIGALSLGAVALHVLLANELATDTLQGVLRSAREYDCAAERKTLPPGDAKTQAEAMGIATRSSISKAIDLAGFARLELLLPHNEAPDLQRFADVSHVDRQRRHREPKVLGHRERPLGRRRMSSAIRLAAPAGVRASRSTRFGRLIWRRCRA